LLLASDLLLLEGQGVALTEGEKSRLGGFVQIFKIINNNPEV
jgi:hypothetical protein